MTRAMNPMMMKTKSRIGSAVRMLSMMVVVVVVSTACVSMELAAAGAFPEPDVVLHGKVRFDGRDMKRGDDVVVQARLIPMGASVTQTRLGDLAEDRYSLRIPIDSSQPVARAGASVVGTTLYLTVLLNGQVRAQIPYEIRAKGLVQEVNFGDVDVDADGIPDGWEQAYLFGLQSGAGDDPDGDGLANRDEYRLGTHPLRVDAPHPADLSPRDNRITIAELSAYYNAWRTTNEWTLSPTNIPIEYVTRATYIWEGGEHYRQDTNAASGGSATAPLWWVKMSAPTGGAAGNGQRDALVGRAGMAGQVVEAPLQVLSIFPSGFAAGVAATVRYQALPSSGMRTYALEDVPPAGWRVVSVEDGGTYDAVNRKVKWGPYFDRKPRSVGYTVVPDRVVAGQRFFGRGSYDGLLVAVTGRRAAVEEPSLVSARVVMDKHPAGWFVWGSPGGRYRVEQSQDLRAWSVLTNGSADGEGRFYFGPALTPESPLNFLRAVELGEAPGDPGVPTTRSPGEGTR